MTFMLHNKIERMSCNSREDKSATDLKFTIEAMMKQFEHFDKLFQRTTECWECIKARMIEIERRPQPIQHPRKQEKRAPIYVLLKII